MASQTEQNGIDIKQALEILSERPAHHHHGHAHANGKDGSQPRSCGCQSTDMPDNIKAMGQVIDMIGNEDEEDAEKKAAELQKEQSKQRQRKIQQELEGMSVVELLQTVQKVQQDRVSTYKEYEGCLETVLKSGNLSQYPETVTKITAIFAVLSDTMKRVQSILQQQHQRNDLSKFVQQLQQQEKEKLQYTAAYHLERIRQQNHDGNGDSIADVYTKNVQSLKQKLAVCVERINEILEELRCEMMED